MNRRTLLVASVALATFLSLTAPAGAAQDPSSQRSAGPPPHADVDGDGLSQALEARLQRAQAGESLEVVVTWSGPPNMAAARAAAGPFAVLEEFSVIDGFLASVTPGQARALARVPGVFRVDENFEVHATNFETDQEYGTERARLEYGVDGTNVNVCVIDTGADPTHEQLDTNIVDFYDAINGQTVAYDDQGHGTHVAATIGGDGDGGSANAAKYQGVAPGVNLYIAKVLSSSGSGTATQIINGIQWCIEKGVDIMSASLGTATGSDGLDSLSRAVNSAVVDHGIVATIAAGNSGDAPQTVGSPGAAEHALTVGAVAKMKDGLVLAPFSSRGPNLAGVLKPEVVSPGVLTVSADAGTTSGYVAGTGTSMATPFAAGAVALLLQANPSLTPANVKSLVASTARDIGAIGADNNSGFGLIDGYGLVTAGLGGSQAGTLPTHTQISGSVPNNGLWSHSIQISGGDVGQPIGVSILINGTLECSAWFFGICLAYEWSPDLDARLIAPDGTVANSRCPLEGWCGTTGVQETYQVASALEGTYTLEVYPFDGEPNNGQGGSFQIDLFTGAAGDATTPSNTPPTADAGPDQTVPDSDGQPGESVTLVGTGSTDSDGTIASYVWSEGGTQIATGANPTVSLGDGTHAITLTVTDDDNATDTDDVVITVSAPPASSDSIHVHDLDDLSQKLARGAWKGVANVAIRDTAEGSVSGFTVSGTFSQNGWSANFSCTDGGAGDTDGTLNGVCRFDSGQLPSNHGKATFTVTSVSLAGYTYDGSGNHDPDGDSNGTTIQLSK